MRVFDRIAVRRHRDRAAATVERWPTCCAMRRSGCWTGWTTPTAASRMRSTSAAAAWSRRCCARAACAVVSCDLSPAMAALQRRPVRGGGRGVPALRAGQLRPGRRQPVAALGQRPARRADPAASGAAAGRAAAGQPARARHLGRVARGADRGGGGADRRRRRRGSRRFPELRDCAHLLQRAGFALPVADVEEIRLLYADPLALLRDLRAAGETNAIRLRDRRVPPRGRCFRRRWRACRARTGGFRPPCGWR